MTDKVEKLQKACLRKPVKIEAASKYSSVDTLKYQYCFVPAKYKDCPLIHILTEMSGSTSMVFTKTCDDTRILSLVILNLDFRAIPINGDMSQAKRLESLNKFKVGECNILVCTDLASRGLDIPSVDMVINYNIPRNPKRSMETARCLNFPMMEWIVRLYTSSGKNCSSWTIGVAISLVSQYDLEWYLQIEKLIDQKLPGFEVQEEVFLLFNRVTEATRISWMKIKEGEGKKKRRRHADDTEEDIQNFLMSYYKKGKTFKKARQR